MMAVVVVVVVVVIVIITDNISGSVGVHTSAVGR
jgi:hypothetical protein